MKKKTTHMKFRRFQSRASRVTFSPSMRWMIGWPRMNWLARKAAANSQLTMVGFHLMKVASWISSVRPPNTTTRTADVSSIPLTLRCRIQETAVCISTPTMSTAVAT